MKVISILFLTILEVLAIRYAYLAWFETEEYFEMVNRSRERAGRVFPFIAEIWTVRAITQHPRLDLWWARTVSLFVVLIGALVLLGTILT